MASIKNLPLQPEGTNFAKAVKKAKLSNQDIADMFSVHYATVSYWKRRGVSKDHVYEMAELLSVSPVTISSALRKEAVEAHESMHHKTKVMFGLEQASTKRTIIPDAFSDQPVITEAKTETHNEPSADSQIDIALIKELTKAKLTARQTEIINSLLADFIDENSNRTARSPLPAPRTFTQIKRSN
jgi:hypothetical protein